jgi:hypothetical protein
LDRDKGAREFLNRLFDDIIGDGLKAELPWGSSNSYMTGSSSLQTIKLRCIRSTVEQLHIAIRNVLRPSHREKGAII